MTVDAINAKLRAGNVNVELRKIYIRHRDGYPETVLQDYARRGFWTLGVETAPFESIDDIDTFSDLGPEVGVSGFIGDVHRGLRALEVTPPPQVDYPEPLVRGSFLHRRLERSTLGEVREHGTPTFIKPHTDHKLFTGFVWDGGAEARRKIVTLPDEVPVWASEPVEFLAEYRTFILDHEVLDCRRYAGDWSRAPSSETVAAAVELMREWKRTPRAYSLDFGILRQGTSTHTALIEMNEGYALGHYGLEPTLYARMLSARWHELVTRRGSIALA